MHKNIKKFIPGVTYIPASGKVYDRKEINNAITAARDGWWTEGKFGKTFEKKFSAFLGVKYVSLVNSGSSANLLALTGLTSSVFGDRRIQKGDEVITVACGFPTTVNPIIQNHCKAVFVDIDIGTKNATAKNIERAITKKTKAIMMAHTLGNPLALREIKKIVKKYNLWFIEDCCDALGSTYQGKYVGTFGDIATFSFYPAHQITMGEGGAVVTNNPLIHRSLRQFRDWGRDCWCDTGKDNTCGRRFDWQFGDLPKGFDHKYVYSQIGYNLKLTDFQAAIGVAQLEKLPKFIQIRKKNFKALYSFFRGYKKYFELPVWEKKADPCWFGFVLVVRENAPFTRLELVKYLEEHNIGTRNLFAGNLVRHPAYKGRKDIKLIDTLENSDCVTDNGFWVGVYPGINNQMLSYIKHTFTAFMKKYLQKSV